MAKRDIDILINARDRYSKEFAKAQGRAGQFGTALRHIGVAAAAYFSVGAIKGFVGELVRSGSAAEEVASKFQAVFKDQATEAERFVGRTANALGRSEVALRGWMATLQDTFVPLGFGRREGREMSEVLTQLAIDLASFNDQAEPDVIRDLQSAIVGNHETMRKYGVIITQATLDQKLLEMGQKRVSHGASEQAKALARLNLILASTSDAQGDAARTAEGFANTARRFGSAWSDLKASIGGAITRSETLHKLMNTLTWTIRNAGDLWSVATNKMAAAIVELGERIKLFFLEQVPGYVKAGIAWLKGGVWSGAASANVPEYRESELVQQLRQQADDAWNRIVRKMVEGSSQVGGGLPKLPAVAGGESETAAAAKAAARQGTVVSRFLTRAPGAGDPAWATKMLKAQEATAKAAAAERRRQTQLLQDLQQAMLKLGVATLQL